MKKIISFILICGLSITLVSCATTSESEDAGDNSAEVSQEVQKLDDGNQDVAQQDDSGLDDTGDDVAQNDQDQTADFADTASSDDLSLDDTKSAQKTEGEAFADEENLDKTMDQADQSVQSAQEPVPEPDASADMSGGPVTITGLDYKANENGGTIVIQTSGPAEYTTEENTGANQFIIDIHNATLPKKFSRPYNTKEFSGVVGLINAHKKPGSSDVRVVVQLKKASAVSVVQDGNSLVLVPGGSAIPQAEESQVAENNDEGSQSSEVAENAQESTEPQGSGQALNSKTLDEFLMGNTKFYGKKISVEILNGELRDVINFISEESGANLVLSDDVTGKISVKLRQIPWDQALVVIMQSKQLGYIRQGNILRIAPLTAIRAETDSAKSLLESQKLLEPIKVKVIPISYSKAKDLEPQLQGFLSTRGSAKADERTNSIVVKDIAENITRMSKLVQRLDTQTPQVYIEGKVVENKVGNLQNFGIQWDSSASEAQAAYNLATKVANLSGSLGLTAKLRMMESDEQVKILSSPRILTLNNQEATIEQATQFPTYTTTIDPTTKLSTKSVSYQTVRLSLKVTPQITAEGGVILKTEILREFAGPVDPNAVDTGARSLNSRSAKSTVLVQNGQTAVLGGIYSTDNTMSNAGIPLLRRIPILGWLFGNDQKTYDKNELIIFLTPRVINKDKAFQLSGSDPEGETL